MESEITLEQRMNNPATLKKIKKEFEKFWGKDTPFQYIDDGNLETDASNMTNSQVIEYAKDNLFDIYWIVDDAFATCDKCNKIESPSENDEYGAETSIYHCNPCREEIEIEKYFSHLKSQGVLKNHANWLIEKYPHFGRYIK